MKHIATLSLLASLLLIGATSIPPAAHPDTDQLATSTQEREEVKAAYYHLRQAAGAETRTDFLSHFQSAIDAMEEAPQSEAFVRAITSAEKRELMRAIDALAEGGDLSKRTAQGLKQSFEEGGAPAATRELIYSRKGETEYTMMLAKTALMEAELLQTMERLGSAAYRGDDMDPTAYGTGIRDIAGGAWGGALTGGGIGAGAGGAAGTVVGGIIGGGIAGPPGAGPGSGIGAGGGAIVGGVWGSIIGAIVGIIWEVTEPAEDNDKGEGSNETQEAASEGGSFKADPDPNSPCNDPMSGVLC